jgi:glycosyltransferase involved in cell wall biosynthesis
LSQHPPATILHLIETAGTGGAESVFIELIKRLPANRWRHIPVVPSHGWIFENLSAAGHRPIIVQEAFSFDPSLVIRLASIVRRERVGLIHAHLFGSAIRAAATGWLCDVPAIATLHGQADIAPNEKWLRAKLAIMRKGLDRLVLVSEPFRKEFIDAAPDFAANSVAIPNGIDVARYEEAQPESRKTLGIDSGKFVIGAVGNAHPAKGYDVLLRAVRILKDRGVAMQCVIVGEMFGAIGERLAALRSELGIEDRVVFTGYRSNVPELLRAFDVFVLSSNAEGFSLATIEAMAAGVPVVATRCGGPESIVADGRTGLLVGVGEPARLADAIERVAHNAPLRERLVAAARTVVHNQFTIDAQVDRYDRLYREVILQHAQQNAKHGR